MLPAAPSSKPCRRQVGPLRWRFHGRSGMGHLSPGTFMGSIEGVSMAPDPGERASPGKRGSPPCRLPPILPAAGGDAQEAGGAAAGMLWDVGNAD